MAELKTKEEELATADTASYDIPPEQSEGPQLVTKSRKLWRGRLQFRSPRPCFLNRRWEISDRNGASYRRGFVDEPRRAVEDADKLLASVMQPLAEGFTNQRSGLEKQWTAATTCLLRPAYCHTALSFVF